MSAETPSSDDSRGRVGLLLAVAGAAVAVFVANYVFFVRTEMGQEIDQAALVGAEHEPQGLISEAWAVLDVISVLTLAAATAVVAAVALLRRRVALASAALVTIAGANVATQVLKRVILERPDLIGEGMQNSLPSGHVTAAATVAVGLTMVAAPRFRAVVAAVAGLFPVVVGVAVVAASWHRPSDVVAAWMVVVATATVTLAVAVGLFGFDRREPRPTWFRRAAVLALAGGAGVLGALGLIGLLAVRSRVLDGTLGETGELVAYVSSAAGTTAVALLSLLAIVSVLRGVAVGRVDDPTVPADPGPTDRAPEGHPAR